MFRNDRQARRTGSAYTPSRRRDVSGLRSLTIRDALGGPWASHWLVWVSLYPPTTLLVLLRETVTPYPEWWWPLLSATVQHLMVGVVIALGAALSRRRHPVLPLAVAGASKRLLILEEKEKKPEVLVI